MMTAVEIDAMVGNHVELHGIKAKPELNGQRGTVVGFVGLSGRFEIRLAAAAVDAALLALHAKNLTAVLPKGTKVEVHGLKAKPELNGQLAKVVSWNEKAVRFNVRLSGVEEPLALKEDNLRVSGGDKPAAAPPAAKPGGSANDAKAAADESDEAPDSPTNVADAPPPSQPPPSQPQSDEEGYYAGVNVTQARKEADRRAVLDKVKDPHEGLRVRAQEDTKTKRTRMQNQLGTATMFIKP